MESTKEEIQKIYSKNSTILVTTKSSKEEEST
jgi:hypothetical protein